MVASLVVGFATWALCAADASRVAGRLDTTWAYCATAHSAFTCAPTRGSLRHVGNGCVDRTACSGACRSISFPMSVCSLLRAPGLRERLQAGEVPGRRGRSEAPGAICLAARRRSATCRNWWNAFSDPERTTAAFADISARSRPRRARQKRARGARLAQLCRAHARRVSSARRARDSCSERHCAAATCSLKTSFGSWMKRRTPSSSTGNCCARHLENLSARRQRRRCQPVPRRVEPALSWSCSTTRPAWSTVGRPIEDLIRSNATRGWLVSGDVDAGGCAAPVVHARRQGAFSRRGASRRYCPWRFSAIRCPAADS